MTKCICFRVWAVRSKFRIPSFRNTLRKFLLRYSLFCDFTRLRIVVSYRRFGTTYRPHLQGLALEGGADMFFFHEMSITTNLGCITSPKKEDIIYIAAEAWSHTPPLFSTTHQLDNFVKEKLRLAMDIYCACWVLYRVKEVQRTYLLQFRHFQPTGHL